MSNASPRGGIVVISAAVGAGHTQAARATQQTLQRLAPDLPVDHIDALDFVPKWFRVKYARGYALTVTHMPTIYGLGFAFTDHPQTPRRTLWERHRLHTEARVQKGLLTYLQQRQPELIIHTHFLAPAAVSRWNAEGLLDVKQFVTVTDVIPHRFWYAAQVDRYFVGHPASVERLTRWGIDPDVIDVSGLPVAPKWTDPLPEAAAIRKTWNIKPTGPVVVLSGGADFVCGPVVRIARKLAKQNPQATIVVLAGRNKKMLAELSKLAGAADGRIVPVSFTDRVHELIEIASLMVTKPGGLTTAECLSKGCPMVLLPPVPGQESHNARFFTEAGAACTLKCHRRLVRRVTELLQKPEQLATMSQCASALYRDGASEIARSAMSELGR
jgi:processive 1,2-diacylglycerol beta-glucosyltransferase